MADCYTFTLRTGVILTYTNADADVPVTLNGLVYAANSVLVDGLKFKCAAGLEVDQQQITISARATDTVSGVPFLQALRNGAFDRCEIQRERAFLHSWYAMDAANPIGRPHARATLWPIVLTAWEAVLMTPRVALVNDRVVSQTLAMQIAVEQTVKKPVDLIGAFRASSYSLANHG